MKKVTLKFLKDKGSVKKGYVGKFEEETAYRLVDTGVAQIYSVPEVKKKNIKNKEKV